LERAEECLRLAELATGDLKKEYVRLAESYKSIADGEQKIAESSDRATVLIVEDDASFAYAASRYLANAGFGTIVAAGSTAALAELESTRIDAAIIDLRLNDGEPQGLSLGRTIRVKSPLVRVILMTAYPDLLAGEIALPGPVLYKPIEPSHLCRKVSACLAN
jgi:DNA-binding NtrC family response regulator